MRSPTPIRLGFALLLAALAAGALDAAVPPAIPTDPAPPVGGCEPAADLDLGARLLELSRGKGTAQAMIRLTLFSLHDLVEVRLDGRTAPWPGKAAGAAFEMPELGSGLPARAIRHLQVTVDLEEGREHHLTFTAEGLDAAGVRHATSASLRVDLDPARAPRVADGLIEYRARVQP